MAKIGLLGGTFNPVHYSHLLIANKAKEKYHLDKVYLMPTYIPPHKTAKHLVSAHHRLNMLKLAVEDNEALEVEPFELEQAKKSYSYDTLKALTTKYPDNEYYFIIGGDMVESLDSWYRIDELKRLVTFIGVQRVGYDFCDETVLPLYVPQTAISSSYIRSELSHQRSVQYLMPNAVIQYIEKEGLYL